MNLEEILKRTPNVIDVYQNGDVTIIVSHNPEGKSFHEGLIEYFKICLHKEYPDLYDL